MPRFTVKRLIALTTAVAVILTITRIAKADVLFQIVVAAYSSSLAAWLVFRSPAVYRNHAALRQRRRAVQDRWAEFAAKYRDEHPL